MMKGLLSGNNRVKLAVYALLIAYLAISAFPVYWMFVTSLKTNAEVYVSRPTYFPQHVTWENYRVIFTTRPFLRYVLNTVAVALATTVISTAIGVPAAYSFSRFRFRGSAFLMFLILASRIVPPISLSVPFFMLISRLGLMDNLLGLVIINTYLCLPFVIWIMKGFFDSVPREMEEAGKIDGCTRLGAFRRLVLPLTFPGLAAASIITFMWTWNEFLFALILAPTPASKNLSVGAMDFIADMFISWNQMSAGGIISSIPAFIFIIFFQKYIIQGLTQGAVKG